MKEDARLGLMLKMIVTNNHCKINSKVVEMGLTSAQCGVLGYLAQHKEDEIHPNDIEREFRLKGATVTGILKRLEEKNFIEFLPSSKDKRYKKIILTSKSQEFHEKMEKIIDESEEQLCKGLTIEQKKQLKDILTIMLKNVEE